VQQCPPKCALSSLDSFKATHAEQVLSEIQEYQILALQFCCGSELVIMISQSSKRSQNDRGEYFVFQYVLFRNKLHNFT
jgi:hypothetical protein